MRYRKNPVSQPDIFALAFRLVGAALWRCCRRLLPTWRALFFRRLAARIPEGARKKHTYLSGSSGSGKSELLKIFVMAQLRKRPRCTTILLDPDGDLAAQVARWQQNRSGERCVIIDLSLQAGFTPVINPLQLADRSPENIDLMAQLFVSAFNEIMDASQLTLNMKVLLHPCVSVLMEMGDASLPDLQRLLDDDRNAGLLARARATHAFRKHREFFEYEFEQTDYHQTKRAICKKIQSLLNYQAFYNLTVGASTVDLPALMDSRKLVIFNLSKGRLGMEAMPAFGKFLVAMLQGLALRREALPEQYRVPTHLMIDECHHFLTPAVEDILKENRKYAFYLTLSQQTIGDKMGPELFNSVMTNTEVKITGFNDKKCLDLMAAKTHTAPERLYRLRLGRFAVKVGKGITPPTFILRTPAFLLGNANAMSAPEWEALKEQQLRAHYKPAKTWAERPLIEPEAGTDPAEFTPLPDSDAPADAPAVFRNNGRRAPRGPKYPF
jgi:hypothetical protein